MKNLVFFFLITFCVKAQTSTKNEQLITDLKTKNVFDVIDKIKPYELDLEALYNDSIAKKLLLKSLDNEAYFEYKMSEIDTNFVNRCKKDDFMNSELRYFLNEKRRIRQYDSIVKSPVLYSKYRDSIFIATFKLHREGTKKESYLPNVNSLFHYVPYPEAHTIAKKRWVDGGKNMDESVFQTLLYMNDPDAETAFMGEIKNLIAKKPVNLSLKTMEDLFFDIRTPFMLRTQFLVMDISTKYSVLPSGDGGLPMAFNCLVLENLIFNLNRNEIKVPIETNCKQNTLTRKEDIENCNFRLKNVTHYRNATNELITKIENSQEYWMKNMPFYKKN